MSGATMAVHTDVAIRSRMRDAIRRATECRTSKIFARATGVSPATVRSWRQGTRAPGCEEMIAAMAACDELAREVAAMVEERKALLQK